MKLHMPKAITFDQFREANVARCLKWHPHGIESWSDSDCLVAIMGELGELASLIKMRNRERDGLPGNKFSPTDEQVAKEAADVVTYLDLFCARNGINLGLAAALKFNEVSERVGFPDRIELASSVDTKQIVYALERAAVALQSQADSLCDRQDYSAELPAEDAQRMREAIAIVSAA